MRKRIQKRTLEVVDEEERDAIFRESVAGRHLREVGRAHNLTIPEVYRILDAVAEKMFSPAGLRRQAMLDIEKLNALKNKYWAQAMTEGDHNAAAVFIRAQERQATLMGLNYPNGHIVTVANSLAPVVEESSTHRLLAAIRLLKAEPPVIEQTPAADEPAA